MYPFDLPMKIYVLRTITSHAPAPRRVPVVWRGRTAARNFLRTFSLVSALRDFHSGSYWLWQEFGTSISIQPNSASRDCSSASERHSRSLLAPLRCFQPHQGEEQRPRWRLCPERWLQFRLPPHSLRAGPHATPNLRSHRRDPPLSWC